MPERLVPMEDAGIQMYLSGIKVKKRVLACLVGGLADRENQCTNLEGWLIGAEKIARKLDVRV